MKVISVNSARAVPMDIDGRSVLTGIGKRGDKNLRRLLVQCARVLMQRIDERDDALGQ